MECCCSPNWTGICIFCGKDVILPQKEKEENDKKEDTISIRDIVLMKMEMESL